MFHRQHRGKVTGIAFNPISLHLYSCGSVGSLALHDTRDDKYQLMRLLTSAVARGDTRSPNTLTVSGDGRHLAFVGPTDFTITVVDAKSLDEVQNCFFHCCFLALHFCRSMNLYYMFVVVSNELLLHPFMPSMLRRCSRPVNNGGWWRWALVSPDGVAPSRMVGVSASVNLPLRRLTRVVPEKGQ